ncbi:MAG: hypothetical protein IT338_13385 [Thermomicrobiales bacterium]|nr:hypothetical protein [Thermomicrobiales bacterium]
MQNLGALDAMRNMMSVIREVSLDELREQAETPPRFMIVAPTAEDARRLGTALTGPEGQFGSTYRAVDESVGSTVPLDAAIVWDPDRTGAQSRVAEALRFESPPVPIVRFEGNPTDAEAIERLRTEIVKRAPERAPALGRALPALRPAAARQIISETSTANAQFSLVSNIPALIPIVGSIAAAGADFIVLTKNQVMMIYKLAAVFGRDLHDQRAILQEVLPVVGAGLMWRSLAREATNFLPFAAGAIPKLAIAYAGTMVVGKAAEFYYRTGLKPSKGQLDDFWRQAMEKVRGLDLSALRRRGGDKDAASEASAAPKITVIHERFPIRKIDTGRSAVDDRG